MILDLAFASEAGGSSFEKATLPLIQLLGDRLAAWVDHHDSDHHARFAGDPRFVLFTKAEHGACPEMISPQLVTRLGAVQTIVCHNDFDGLASAAKWIRGGTEPYPGCDADARAIDTRVGTAGPHGQRFDRALRGKSRDQDLLVTIVRHLAEGLTDPSLWEKVDEAARELLPLEQEARVLAEKFAVVGEIAWVDATKRDGPYDKTLLLLLGQARAPISLVIDQESVTLAAPFDSGRNFLTLLNLSGGMPTVVSIPRSKLAFALDKLSLGPGEIAAIAPA